MDGIVIHHTPDGVKIEGAGHTAWLDTRTDERAGCAALLAIAASPRWVPIAEIRYCLALPALHHIPRMWKTRAVALFTRLHPPLGAEVAERWAVQEWGVGFSAVRGLDRPVLSVTNRALVKFRRRVRPPSNPDPGESEMRVMMTPGGAAYLGNRLIEVGDVVDDPPPAFLDAMRDVLVPLAAPATPDDIEQQETLGWLLRVHGRPWGAA
ncbi:MAG: hypothetical protein AB7P16_28495 [Bradyrhizobium sp.]|uniref:hypothetical protein n=1 Tax=Bradyrhizobium sp. TaxID=376 RepID=UPI003D0EA310